MQQKGTRLDLFPLPLNAFSGHSASSDLSSRECFVIADAQDLRKGIGLAQRRHVFFIYSEAFFEIINS